MRYTTAAKQPTLIIIAKVTVRTRTIDLKVLLGRTEGVGVGIGVDEDGSLNFSLLFESQRVVVATTSSLAMQSDMIVSKVAKR